MPRSPFDPFVRLGTTPEFKKVLGGAVALSPVAPLVAETGMLDKASDINILRISNYQNTTVVGQTRIPSRCHTLSYSPDGKCLLALPGSSKGWWSTLLIYTEPWDSPTIIGEDHSLGSIFHATWLDDQTILVAGTVAVASSEPCIAVFDIRAGSFSIIHSEGQQPSASNSENHLDDAACSPSGLVVFSMGYGRNIVWYQLNQSRNALTARSAFYAKYTGYGSQLLLEESGHSIVLLSGNLPYDPWIGLFNREGAQLSSLSQSAPQNGAMYRYGTVCLPKRDRYEKALLVYQIREAQFCPWCSLRRSGGEGVDLALHDGRIVVAVEDDDHTAVFELTDFDIVQLGSEDAQQRIKAAQSLGGRRLPLAIPALQRALGDEDANVQVAAIEALTLISDPKALPPLIRMLGHTQDDSLQSKLLAALQKFPMTQLTPAVLDCLARSGKYRLGAVRVLDAMPMIQALEELCEALQVEDQEVQLIATHALQKRGDLRACIALLAYLNAEDSHFRLAAHQAVTALLEAGHLLSSAVIAPLELPLGMVAYADEVIMKGCMQAFETIGDPAVGQFFIALATASVRTKQSLPQLLTALDVLATHHGALDRTSSSIGLTIALICADVLKGERRLHEALNMYRHAVSLAQRAKAPQIEWRCWDAVGICYETLQDDQSALTAFRNAMTVIDRLWFLLLEEDKLQDFFQGKALLYDRASLCALRLGYHAFALECTEKAKTRYLGDLIARRQMDPRIVLNRDIEEFWENIGRLRSTRVAIGAAERGTTQRVEIIAVQSSDDSLHSNKVIPERLGALEAASQHDPELENRLGLPRRVWQVITAISTDEDDFYRPYVEDIYQSLLPVYQAVKSAALPITREEQDVIVRQYNDAAQALNEAGGGNQDAPFWVFVEYRNWISEVCNAVVDDEITLLLDAVMEALNGMLHHEPVFGTSSDEEADAQSPVFVTRVFRSESSNSEKGFTTIESPLELHTHSRWRYISRLARGEIVSYREVANSLVAQPDVAQLQFSITEYGTIVYISHSTATKKKQAGVLPDLQGEDDLHVFTNPEVTLSMLQQRLLESEESWFVRYKLRKEEDGHQAWKQAMDRTLEWLYAHLFAPLDEFLKQKGVQQLRIIPHRALHLIPFSALFSTDANGDRHYLIDDYAIEYAPSATLQHICRERAQNRVFQQRLTAVSNPTSDLPLASTEVRQVIGHFPTDKVHLVEGSDAQLASIAAAVSSTSVFHFAGHGRYDWNDPLASHLLFAQGEMLSLMDLFSETLLLPATTVAVLSACETNVTRPEDLADEYLGLASGFLFAGTPSVVSTLWAVDDIASSLLMQQFYLLHFEEGLPANIALQAAQRWLRDTVDYEFVIAYIEEQLTTLEQASRHKSKANQKVAPVSTQMKVLKARRLSLSHQKEKATIRKNPYAHPYFWAAFTISGG